VACCPFHDEKTPSFSVSPAKNIFKCFGCGKAGNAVTFVMEHERISYVDAIKVVARKYGIEIVEKELTPEEAQQNNDRESMMSLNAFAAQHFTNNLWNSAEGKTIAQPYCTERGIPKLLAEKFMLGYCLNQRNAFAQAAQKAGYKKDFLIKTGLCYQRGEDGDIIDRFAGRLIFPILSIGGRVVGFGGRILAADKTIAKYVNSPESEVYHKSNTLYGIFFAKKGIVQQSKCYLVEGYTDTIAMHSAGVENVVASSGTSLTTDQIKLIKRFTPNITVVYDGDAAGIKASLRGIDMLLEEGINVKTLLLPDGDDPDSFIKNHSATEFNDYVSQNEEDFIRFKIKTLLKNTDADPIKKAAAASNIVQSIAMIADHITRSVYIGECAKLIGMDEETLSQEVGTVRRKKYFAGKTGGGVSYNSAQETESAGIVSDSEAVPNRDVPYLIEDIAGAPVENAPPQNDTAAISAPPVFADNALCNEQERELIYYLLKFGEMPLGDVRLSDYIIGELDADGIVLHNIEYRRIFDEYKQLKDIENGVSADNFLHHSNPRICSLAADLLSSKYTPSRLWDAKNATPITEEEQLHIAIPKAINAYKAKIVEFDIREKTKLLAALDDDDDSDLVAEIEQLYNLRNIISHALERVMP
jgi:DNA primase